MPLEPTQSGAATVSAPHARSYWKTLDKIGSYISYIFAVFIVVGGICTPLRVAVYSLLFRA